MSVAVPSEGAEEGGGRGRGRGDSLSSKTTGGSIVACDKGGRDGGVYNTVLEMIPDKGGRERGEGRGERGEGEGKGRGERGESRGERD